MSSIDIESLFLGISIFISVLLYIISNWNSRRRQREEYAERAAIQSLSPLLIEIHSLEKACELLGRYPENYRTLKAFFDPKKYLERVSDAYVYLSNISFEHNSLNLLMLLYHTLAVFDHYEALDTPDPSRLIDLASTIGEVVIPLRKATTQALESYRKQIGVRVDITYDIPFEYVILQIEDALRKISRIMPSKDKDILSKKDQKAINKIKAIWTDKM